MHTRQHFVHSHIDKALQAKLNIKKRAVQISKGDTVKVMAGSKKGNTGKVTRVNLRTGKDKHRFADRRRTPAARNSTSR